MIASGLHDVSTMMSASHLLTVGYEGADIDAFVACLGDAGVGVLVDVRELPLSRKKGFSKAALSHALRDVGIAYVHMRGLGCPREIRLRYREDRSWPRYTRDFLAYLSTQRAAIDDLATLARAKACCVMCFEADFAACHRTYVARAAYDAGAPDVMHLRVGAEPVEDAEVRSAP